MHSLYSASSGCTACAVSGSAPDRAGHRAVERAARDGHGGVGDRPKPAHARGRDLERSRPAQVTDDVRSAQRARIGIAAPIRAPPPPLPSSSSPPRVSCLPVPSSSPSTAAAWTTTATLQRASPPSTPRTTGRRRRRPKIARETPRGRNLRRRQARCTRAARAGVRQ